ncbi:MAG: HlyC/CorC family transporter [Pelagibacterales bacterium]|nr:HlyC/CorC family transporter [Pelagibacterales bacterium]
MEGQSGAKRKLVKNKQKSRHKKLFNFLLSLFGRKTKKSFLSVINHLVESYEREKLISFEEKKMIKNIASLGEKKVSNIMTPRSDLIAIRANADLEEVKKVITNDGHTRIPVFRENLDEIIGFIHSKDLSKFLCQKNPDFSIPKIMRKILFVPGSMKLIDLMLRMRMARIHVAIVLDEFGGVDGFVTIENIMEEIVGDIEDEHDLPSDNSFFRIKKIDELTFHFGGRVEIKKAEEILQHSIKYEEGNFETLGGLLMSIFKRIPEIGEELENEGLKFKIIDADSRFVKVIEIKKIG